MKSKILKIFQEANGEFISGEALSEELNCSRTAIWKHIEELRQAGYEFEAVRRSGYRLVASPDMPFDREVMNGLKTQSIGQTVHFFPVLDSTQITAHSIAKEGAVDGTTVIADQQVGGKGRMGRPWHSPSGSGIWMSIILRPELELHRCPQMTLLTAVAVVQAIRDTTGLEAQIKWPNDILLNGKKICGILTELNAEWGNINYLIIGIGMNVNVPSFPQELQDIATSLYIEAGQEVKRVSLIQRILEHLEILYKLYIQDGFSAIKPLWESYANTIGRRVLIRGANQTMEGLALGIDDEGVLLVQKDDGQIEKVYSADIELGAKR